MSMVGKTFKQKMAAFLAVCMVASALPTGPVFAAEEPKEESSAASLVEFDVEKLKEAVEKAVKKEKMVTPPTVVASASVASFDTSSYELSRAEGLLKDGTKLPEDTDLRIFLVPDDLGYDADNTYTVTGSESLIFMLENKGDEEQGYQLVFGNKITDVIEVKSKAQLLQEYELGEEETQTETTAATPSNADSIQEGQIAPENESQAQTQTEADSERNAQSSEQAAAPQESISEDSIQEGQVAPENETTAAETETAAEDTEKTEAKAEESQAGETEAETSRETEAQETEKEETRAESEEKEPIVISNPEKEDDKEEASQVTIGKIFDMLTGSIVAYGAQPEITATPSDASQEDKPAADVPETSEPVKETPETSAPAESVAVETTEAEPEETTMAPAAEAAVPEQTAEKASPSNATEAEETVDRTFEGATGGYVKLNAEISTSTLIMRKDSFEKEEVTGILKPMARVMSLFAGDDTEDETKVTASSTRAVAFVTTAYSDVVALAETSGADIKVNLYDYSGTGQSNTAINNYLQTEGLDIRFNYHSGRIYNYWEYGSPINGNIIPKVNIYQGITEAEGEEQLLSTLFPDEQPNGVGYNTLHVYPNVTPEFIQYDTSTGQYSYDSSENYAYYDSTTNTLSQSGAGDGFWPFNTSDQITDSGDFNTGENWFFGMSMSFDFYKPENGQFQGEDMVFYFSGDDDVWVYLVDEKGNEQLVLDMGGNHGRMDGWINFADGTVTYSNENALARERFPERTDGWGNVTGYNNPYPVVYTSRNDCTYENTGTQDVYSVYETDEFRDFINNGSNFTLKFYYLERGGSASNCKIQFNLPVIPNQGITIQKQLSGKDLEDYRDNEFKFRVVSSDNEKALANYRETGEDGSDEINIQDITVNGISSATAAVTPGYYFYIEEIETGNATVSWEVTTSNSSQGGTAEGTKSSIYRAPDDETQLGFLFLCTNQYGELTPSVAKTANMVGDDSGIYDITLSVTGDESSIETGTSGGSAVDMVVVLDKSQSMADAGYDDDVRAAVLDLAQSLSEKSNGQSRMRIVTFGGDEGTGTVRKNAAYYGESGDSAYYNVETDWQTLSEELVTENGSLYQTLQGISFNENTHSAGGFLGAKAAFDGSIDGHQKVVVYLTDGEPNSFVERITRNIWWWSETHTIYFEQPSGRDRNDWLERDISNAEYGIEAARVTLGMLKTAYPDAAVYTIGYGSYAGGNNDWLKPLPSGNDSEEMITSSNGSEGITRFFPAADYEQLVDVFETISDTTTTVVKVTNPVVTDQLSQHAIIYNGVTVDTGNGNFIIGPNLKLGEQPLTASYNNNNGIIQYHLGDTLIAEFTPPTTGDSHNGTITWYVATELGVETRNLTFQVQAVGDYHADAAEYPDIPNSNTGTHSSQNPSNGYYSNGIAKLEYGPEDERESTDFPKPVIRPVQQYTTISLKKSVTGNAPDSWSFTFQIGLDRELNTTTEDIKKVSENDVAAELQDFAFVYEVTLSSDSNELAIEGVPIDAAYRVVELAGNTDTHKVVSTSYEIKSTGGNTIASGSGKVAPSSNNTVPKDGLEILYTNEMGEYAVIEISKIVDDQNGSVADDAEFGFRVEYSDDEGKTWETYSNYRQVLVRAGETVSIKIEPEDMAYLFRVIETDTQGAVRTDYRIDSNTPVSGETTAAIGDLDEGEKVAVTFTNHYYSHSIVLNKKVADKLTGESEMIEDADYTFTINFTVDEGSQLTQVNVSRNGETATSVEVSNNSLTVTLKKDETLTISDLPAYVSGYTVTEDLSLLNTDKYTDGKFEVTLEGITASSDSGTNPTIDKTQAEVTGTFTGTANQIDTITYTNEYSYLLENLTITKELVASASDDTPTPADQDVTFTFEIVNQDTNESFTATVTVGKGESSGTVTIQVPVSKEGYEIQEISSTVRYKAKEDSVTAGKTENGYSAKFQNYKTGDDYFTSVSTIVNEVNGSYEFTNGGATAVERIASSLDAVGAYLLPDQKKDGSGDEDMNQPT